MTMHENELTQNDVTLWLENCFLWQQVIDYVFRGVSPVKINERITEYYARTSNPEVYVRLRREIAHPPNPNVVTVSDDLIQYYGENPKYVDRFEIDLKSVFALMRIDWLTPQQVKYTKNGKLKEYLTQAVLSDLKHYAKEAKTEQNPE